MLRQLRGVAKPVTAARLGAPGDSIRPMMRKHMLEPELAVQELGLTNGARVEDLGRKDA